MGSSFLLYFKRFTAIYNFLENKGFDKEEIFSFYLTFKNLIDEDGNNVKNRYYLELKNNTHTYKTVFKSSSFELLEYSNTKGRFLSEGAIKQILEV
jgi:hypothetical protein